MSHSKTWIYLPVEIKAREFDSKLLLAAAAAERGHKVLIGEFGVFNKYPSCLPAGVIFDKDLSPRKKNVFRRYSDARHHIVVSDEESLGIYENPDFWTYNRISSEALRYISRFFVWGRRQGENIERIFPEHAHKFVTTGTVRTDILKAPWNALYEDAADELRERFGPFILFPSNLGSPVTKPGARQLVVQKFYNSNTVVDEDQLNFLLARFDHKARNAQWLRSTFKAIRDKYPDYAIVIRPHPTDPREFWDQIAEGIHGCHVVFEETSIPWVMAADAMFHFGCGTAVEALLVGKRPINFLPHFDARFDKTVEASIPPVVNDEASLLDEIGKSLSECRSPGLERVREEIGWLNDFILYDGVSAKDNIIDEIERVAQANIIKATGLQKVLLILCLRVRLAQAALRKRYRKFSKLRQPSATSGRSKPKSVSAVWPYTTTQEVLEQLRCFEHVGGRFKGVRATKVCRNVFLIEK